MLCSVILNNPVHSFFVGHGNDGRRHRGLLAGGEPIGALPLATELPSTYTD